MTNSQSIGDLNALLTSLDLKSRLDEEVIDWDDEQDHGHDSDHDLDYHNKIKNKQDITSLDATDRKLETGHDECSWDEDFICDNVCIPKEIIHTQKGVERNLREIRNFSFSINELKSTLGKYESVQKEETIDKTSTNKLITEVKSLIALASTGSGKNIEESLTGAEPGQDSNKSIVMLGEDALPALINRVNKAQTKLEELIKSIQDGNKQKEENKNDNNNKLD